MPQRKYISPNKEKEMFFSGIYKIYLLDREYIYIGSAKRFAKRFKEHFVELQANQHYNSKLQNIFNKHGIDKFRIEIVELHFEYDSKYLFEREQYWIDYYKNNKEFDLINASLKAEGGCGKISEERKKEMSIKYAGKGNPNYGRNHSPEKRREISEKLKISFELNKEKHSERFAEYTKTGEWRKRALKAWEKRSEAQLETLRKMNQKFADATPEEKEMKKQKQINTLNKKYGDVLVYNQNNEFKFRTAVEAANFLKVSQTAILQAIKTKGTCRGMYIKRIKNDT